MRLFRNAITAALLGLSCTTWADTEHVVTSVGDHFSRHYVFSERGQTIAESLRNQLALGAFKNVTEDEQLATVLTKTLLDLSNDKHVRVVYHPTPRATNTGATVNAANEQSFFQFMNYGVERVERLPANIGYLAINAFLQRDAVLSAYGQAMSLLTHTDALIIDLRRNGGGQPESVAALASYFFEKPTHLVDMYWREDNSTDSFWTDPKTLGAHYGQQKPVYVLISAQTGSGAEEFAYDLQQTKRGTIVGETSAGAANPGGFFPINAHFSVFVPTGRAINPISKTNWEGVGVKPDVTTSADDALKRAQILALQTLLEKPSDPQRRAMLKRRLDELSKQQK